MFQRLRLLTILSFILPTACTTMPDDEPVVFTTKTEQENYVYLCNLFDDSAEVQVLEDNTYRVTCPVPDCESTYNRRFSRLD